MARVWVAQLLFMPAKKKKPLNRLQREVLAEWRGLDEPRDLSRYEHRLSDVLMKFMERAGLADRCLEEELTAIWQKAVGEFIAANSKPTGWKDGVLQVAVLQPALRFSLQGALKQQILAKLRPLFGSRPLRDIRFQVG